MSDVSVLDHKEKAKLTPLAPPANSLEGALAALGKLFGKSYSAVESTRDSFYTNLYDLQASAEYKALAGSAHLRVLANTDRDTLASNARADFGAFLAVHFLLPLSLDGAWGVLGTIHTDLYAKYQLDNTLSATKRAAGQANFSDRYLADRATMLAWLLKGNQQDALSSGQTMFVKTTQPGVSDIWQFIDMASERKIEVSPTLAQGRHEVYFGNEEGNSFTGRMREDYLYGGGGNDILEAGTGRVCKPPVLRTQPSNKDRRRVSAYANFIGTPYALRIFSGKRLSENHEICQRAAQWVS